MSPKEINSHDVMCRGSSPLEKGEEQHWCLTQFPALSQTGWDLSICAPQKRTKCLPLQEFWARSWAVRWEASASKGVQMLELLVEGFTGPSVNAEGKGCFAP